MSKYILVFIGGVLLGFIHSYYYFRDRAENGSMVTFGENAYVFSKLNIAENNIN